LDKCKEDNTKEEGQPHDYIDEDDEDESKYWDDSGDDADEFSFADADMEELKSVLYKHVTILAVKVGDRSGLAMFITLIHTKGEVFHLLSFIYRGADKFTGKHTKYIRMPIPFSVPLHTWLL